MGFGSLDTNIGIMFAGEIGVGGPISFNFSMCGASAWKLTFSQSGQAHGLAVAGDVADPFLDQNFMLIAFGIVVDHGRAVRRQRRCGASNNYLRPRTLHVCGRSQIYRAGAHRDCNIGLLLIVG